MPLRMERPEMNDPDTAQLLDLATEDLRLLRRCAVAFLRIGVTTNSFCPNLRQSSAAQYRD
jgi:hypothetical protein